LPWLSIAADGERHAFKGLVYRVLITSNRDNLGNMDSRSTPVGVAVTILTSVGIARISIQTSDINDPLECFTGVSTTTSGISVVTIYDFLRRTSRDPTSGNQIGRLRFFGGRESPARTTLSLVLDSSSLSSSDSVDSTARSGHRGYGFFLFREFFGGTEAEEALELFSRPISKFRVSEGGSWAV